MIFYVDIAEYNTIHSLKTLVFRLIIIVALVT
jgi:hypothetical protein